LFLHICNRAPFDNQPRQAPNPKYAEIKESIRNRGLDHSPTITARKDGDSFMISDGGNTRLQILNELYLEYSQKADDAEQSNNPDEAKINREKADNFFHHEWRFRPWKSETHALAGHMAENDQRGSMLFIEKALAAQQMYELIDPDKTLSMRSLADAISDTGWTISQSLLSSFLYAANELNPLIPTALWHGIGRPQVLRILKVRRSFMKYFKEHPTDTEFNFDDVWQTVLRQNDDSVLDLEHIKLELCNQCAEKNNELDIFIFRAEIDLLISGNNFSSATNQNTPLLQQASGDDVIQTTKTNSEGGPKTELDTEEDNSGSSGNSDKNKESLAPKSGSTPTQDKNTHSDNLQEAIIHVYEEHVNNRDLDVPISNLIETANHFFGDKLIPLSSNGSDTNLSGGQ